MVEKGLSTALFEGVFLALLWGSRIWDLLGSTGGLGRFWGEGSMIEA